MRAPPATTPSTPRAGSTTTRWRRSPKRTWRSGSTRRCSGWHPCPTAGSWTWGCGTGMILFRLAHSSERYVGADFSAEVVDRVRRRVDSSPEWTGVEVVHCAAPDVADVVEGPFDLVVINSVIQCFPSTDYLADVLNSAASLIAPGGSIFLGDIRNGDLAGAFHAELVVDERGSGMDVEEFAHRVEQSIAADDQLQLGPSRTLLGGVDLRFCGWCCGLDRLSAGVAGAGPGGE
ncbi:class I SAM-dependent methyltransferase [Saccharothrix xinjiangensis]